MGELGTMFSQLMEMIELQGQDIQRIDDDVNDIESNLSSGLTELQTTYNNSSNYIIPTCNTCIELNIFEV